MDISSIAVNSSVYGVLPTKTSDCFTVSIGKRKNSNNNKFLFGFSNRSSRNLKIQAVHLDEVAADNPKSLTNTRLKDIEWPSPSDKIPFWKREFQTWDSNSKVRVNTEKDSDLLHVIHVTAEMAPIAKVGGLGDVVTGLSRACLSRGHKVDIMLPFYECIQKENIQEISLMSTYNSYYDGNWIETNAYSGMVSGIPVILLEPMNQFFKGEDVYGGSYNELEAYLFFSRACLEWMQNPLTKMQVTGTQRDVIHVHEWQDRSTSTPLLGHLSSSFTSGILVNPDGEKQQYEHLS